MPDRDRTLHLHLSPLERMRLWVEILAFVAAGAWGVYVFVYQTNIAPLFAAAQEAISANLTPIATLPDARVDRVEVTLRNNGGVTVDNVAFVVNLYGLTDIGGLHPSTEKIGNTLVRGISGVPNHWHLIGSYSELHSGAQGGPKGSHLILAPGGSVELSYTAVVPRGRYVAVKLSLSVEYMRYPNPRGIPLQLTRDRDGAYELREVKGARGSDLGLGVNNDWYFPV